MCTHEVRQLRKYNESRLTTHGGAAPLLHTRTYVYKCASVCSPPPPTSPTCIRRTLQLSRRRWRVSLSSPSSSTRVRAHATAHSDARTSRFRMTSFATEKKSDANNCWGTHHRSRMLSRVEDRYFPEKNSFQVISFRGINMRN